MPGSACRAARWFLFGASCLVMAGAARASERHRFDIPAGPALQALQAFGVQSGKQVLFPYDAVTGAQVPAISGQCDDAQVLHRLAAAAGLVITSDDGRTITLARAGSPSATAVPEAIPEIIVTARRRSEAASKAPMAVKAVSGSDLDDDGVDGAVQLQYLVSSLVVSHDKQGVNIGIRGVTTTDTTTKGEPGINFNTDGIPVSRSEEQALGFFDLQRVEVLSGPQGTLYGKSSTGGAINVITNPPAQVFQASAGVELGNYASRRFDAMINLPLSPKVAIRAAFAADHHDGYVYLLDGQGQVTGKANDQNTLSGRVSLLARPTKGLTVRLTVTGGYVGGVGYGNNGVTLDIGDDHAGQGTTTGFTNRFAGHVDDRYGKINTQVDQDIGAARLSYLGAFGRYRTDNLTPNYGYGTDGQRLYIRDRYDAGYHELRLTNIAEGRLDYVAGVNYANEIITENGHFWGVGEASVAAYGYDPDYLNLIDLLNRTRHTTWSAYGHASYAVTGRLHVSGGMRWSRDTTRRAGTLAKGPFSGAGPDGPIPWLNARGTVCAGTDDCIGTPNNGASHSTKMTYDLGVNYQATGHQLFYATVATGYKPGGFNDYDPATGNVSEYGAEDMTAYEAGYKLRLPGRLLATSSLYHYDYRHSQVTQMLELDNDPTNLVIYTRLAPEHMDGWENNLVLSLNRDNRISLTANFEKARYGRFAAGPTFNIDFTGKAVDRVPGTVLAAGYDHDWRLTSGAVVSVHADTRYSASYRVSDFFQAIQYRQVPFTRSSVSLTYAAPAEAYKLQAFVSNIENRVQISGGAVGYIAGLRHSAGGSISEPRTFGVRLTRNF